jgi:aldehyde dehydrogenase family 7 protein A1
MLTQRSTACLVYHAYGVNRRSLSSRASTILASLDLSTTEPLPGVFDGEWKGSGLLLASVCPTTGEALGSVRSVGIPRNFQIHKTSLQSLNTHLQATSQELHTAIAKSQEAFQYFRNIPAPRRGEILRQIREKLAEKVTVHMSPVPRADSGPHNVAAR